MKEKKIRSVIIARLKSINAFAVENEVHDGCPDICTVMGWIELKVCEMPRRTDSPIKPFLRQSQRIWLHRWCAHGGKAWVLTRVGDIWTLHTGPWAAKNMDHVARDEFLGGAVESWPSTPSTESLIAAMQKTDWSMSEAV